MNSLSFKYIALSFLAAIYLINVPFVDPFAPLMIMHSGPLIYSTIDLICMYSLFNTILLSTTISSLISIHFFLLKSYIAFSLIYIFFKNFVLYSVSILNPIA